MSETVSKSSRSAAGQRASSPQPVRKLGSQRRTAQRQSRFSFGRATDPTAGRARVAADAVPERGLGSPGLATRLGMFPTAPTAPEDWARARRMSDLGEQLAPIVPPIRSAGSWSFSDRTHIRRTVIRDQRPVSRQVVARGPGPTLTSAREQAPTSVRGRAASRRSRLSARGYTVVLLLVAGLFAGTAAVTQVSDSALRTAAVAQPTSTLVVHEGDTISSLASARANGANPVALADTIRALNGLSSSDVLLPGDVLIVPAS